MRVFKLNIIFFPQLLQVLTDLKLVKFMYVPRWINYYSNVSDSHGDGGKFQVHKYTHWLFLSFFLSLSIWVCWLKGMGRWCGSLSCPLRHLTVHTRKYCLLCHDGDALGDCWRWQGQLLSLRRLKAVTRLLNITGYLLLTDDRALNPSMIGAACQRHVTSSVWPSGPRRPKSCSSWPRGNLTRNNLLHWIDADTRLRNPDWPHPLTLDLSSQSLHF